MRVWILGASVGLLLWSGGAALAEGPPLPGDSWPRSQPAVQGLDAERLAELVRLIDEGKRFPDLHSLLIVRRGYLVLEEYFDGWNADRLHTLQSVSKSFTSALIGIAIEQRAIRGVDEKILDFFPQQKSIENLDERKRAMTLGDDFLYSHVLPAVRR